MEVMRRVASRLLVTVLAGMAVAGQVQQIRRLDALRHGFGGALISTATPSFLAVLGADAVVSVTAALLALALAYGVAGRSAAGRSGAGSLALALSAGGYLTAYAGLSELLTPLASLADGPDRAGVWLRGHFLLVEFVLLAAILRFSASFPKPLPTDALAAPGSLPVGLSWLQALRRRLLGATAAGVAALVAFVMVLAASALTGSAQGPLPGYTGADIVRLAALTAVVLNLRRAYTLAAPDERRRMTWLAAGLGFLLGALGLIISGNVLLAVTGWQVTALNWRPILLDLGVIGLVWGTSLAVFPWNRPDPVAVVRFTAICVGLACATLFLAAGLEALFSDILVSRVSLPSGLGTAAAVAVLLAQGRRAGSVIGTMVDDVTTE